MGIRGSGTPLGLGWEFAVRWGGGEGMVPMLLSCNYVNIDHLGSETTTHLMTNASKMINTHYVLIC